MESNTDIDMVEDAVIEFSLSSPTRKDDDVTEESTLASVIIEELDENALSKMNVDMAEFVEARALEMKDITPDVVSDVYSEQSNSAMDVTTDVEDQDILLTTEEEDQLTKQFLNGELTFSEYSSRMDPDIDAETVEVDQPPRNDSENEDVGASKIIQQKPSKSRGRYKRKKRTLPPVLQGLMGEANLRFARGDIELAAQICMEIIRQVPSAPEPFHTLAMIYEADQPEKSLQFALIAAHLSPKDADQWVRLGNLSMESGDLKQAITCYNKAIQADPKNLPLYETRGRLLERNGDRRAFLKGYSKLLHQLEPEDGEHIIKYAKMLAKRYMEENNNEQALEAMENIFSKCPTFITLEEVNIMTEILIALKKFKRCLHILTTYTRIWVKYKNVNDKQSPCGAVKKAGNEKKEEPEDQSICEIECCGVPDDVVVDLKAKFLVILIELDQIKLVEKLLSNFYEQENPEISGDLFLDIAETLMGKKEFERALMLLDPLVNSDNYSLAAVWLRHAECWVGCKDLKKATKSYEVVAKLSPQHLGARTALAKLYELKGQYNKAIKVLEQDSESDTLDPLVIYRRTLLLHKVQRYDEYFQSGMLLFSRHCVHIRNKVELNGLTRAYGVRQRLDSLKLHRMSRGEKFEEENAPVFLATTELSEQSEYFLLLDMCKLACKLKKYGLLERISLSALTSKRFEKRNTHIMFLGLLACIYNDDSYHGYNIVRLLIRVCQRPNSWNLLNIIIQKAQDSRHNRFIMRLLGREDVFSYLNILHANNCLVSGTYKYALNDYISLFKVAPSSLLALLISVTLLQMGCQKLSAKKNQLVIQALAFLNKYCQLRGEDGKQESYYNMGRAFHQIGLLPAAVHFYKLVLDEDPGDLVEKNSSLLDLKQEAAFNLHLVYMQSENYLLARMYLEKSEMSVALADKIEFKKLCDIVERVAKAPAAKKADILKRFIHQCRLDGRKLKTEFPDADVTLFPVLRLILPCLERERGPSNLKEKSLANLYVRVFCLGKGSKDAIKLVQYKIPSAKKIAGCDFAEKAYWILKNRLPRESSGFTVARINLFLENISSGNEILQQKDETFKVLLGKINALEFKWITRIILKDLKLGIGTKRILQVFHPDANALYDVSSNLRQVCDRLHDPRLRYHYDIEVFSHFKPMLLERYKIEDVKKLFGKGEEYFVQSKYDGERSQMHMKDGRYKYFTRQGYDITKYPGYGETSSAGFMSSVFSRLLNPECKSIILDGELMGWHKVKKLMGSKGMNFDVKRLSENSHHQPCFIAFDIILYNDVLLHNEPYEKRLRILKDAFKEEEGCLMLCKSTTISKGEELCVLFNESMKNKEEGIVIKKSDTLYKPNVRDGTGCYKIKAEYSDDLVQDVDLIILGGYYGDGKFMGLIKSFLMGVASATTIPGENPSKFLSVVSVSNGLSMEELKQLQKRFEDKWKSECPKNVTPPAHDPPKLWIHPEDSVILTIRATEMTRSNDYPTGYSLRFPRVMSVRADKPWYNVCTTTELKSLIKDTRPIQKLTKREVDYDDMGEASETKVRRITKQRSPRSEEKLPKANIFDNPPLPLTRLFNGKEICVINGNDDLPKERIERILLEHRAKVVQSPLKENYCIIVGNVKTARASNIIQSKMYDVVTIDWLKRVTEEDNWSSLQEFLPWDLICGRESTRRQLAQYYDDYYDHYTVDANEQSLSRSFKKAEETVNTMEFNDAQMKEMDEELFSGETSPYSIFRGIVGYFDDQSDWSKFEFRFMTGTIKESVDDSVTHVFVNGNSIGPELRCSIDKSGWSSTIVRSEWIGECFKRNELVPATEYLLH